MSSTSNAAAEDDDSGQSAFQKDGRTYVKNSVGALWALVSKPTALETWSNRPEGTREAEALPANWKPEHSITGDATLMKGSLSLLDRSGSMTTSFTVRLRPSTEVEHVGHASLGWMPPDWGHEGDGHWWCEAYLPQHAFTAIWEDVRSGRANLTTLALVLDLLRDQNMAPHGAAVDHVDWFLVVGRHESAVATGSVRSVTSFMERMDSKTPPAAPGASDTSVRDGPAPQPRSRGYTHLRRDIAALTWRVTFLTIVVVVGFVFAFMRR